MTLAAADIESYLDFNIGDGIPSQVGLLNLVNQAGTYLCNMHRWRWLQQRPMHLSLRALVTISGATVSGTTLTVANDELDNYSRVIGDRVKIPTGSSSTPGFYEILAHSGDALTLRSAPGDSVGDVGGTIDTNTVALPSDFKGFVPAGSIEDSDAVVRGVTFVTPTYLNQLRSTALEGGTDGRIYACLGFAGPTPAPAAEPRTLILEIAPTPTTNSANALTGFYNAKWQRATDVFQVLFLPEELEGPFITLCEHYARGRLESDEEGLGRRLAAFEADPDLIAAKRWDGGAQASYGLMRGGAAQQVRGRHLSVWPGFTVNDPA